MPSIVSFVKTLENFFFRFRVATLAVLLVWVGLAYAIKCLAGIVGYILVASGHIAGL